MVTTNEKLYTVLWGGCWINLFQPLIVTPLLARNFARYTYLWFSQQNILSTPKASHTAKICRFCGFKFRWFKAPKGDEFPRNGWTSLSLSTASTLLCSCTAHLSAVSIRHQCPASGPPIRTQLGCMLDQYIISTPAEFASVFDKVAIFFHKGSISYSFPFVVGIMFLWRCLTRLYKYRRT